MLQKCKIQTLLLRHTQALVDFAPISSALSIINQGYSLYFRLDRCFPQCHLSLRSGWQQTPEVVVNLSGEIQDPMARNLHFAIGKSLAGLAYSVVQGLGYFLNYLK